MYIVGTLGYGGWGEPNTDLGLQGTRDCYGKAALTRGSQKNRIHPAFPGLRDSKGFLPNPSEVVAERPVLRNMYQSPRSFRSNLRVDADLPPEFRVLWKVLHAIETLCLYYA